MFDGVHISKNKVTRLLLTVLVLCNKLYQDSGTDGIIPRKTERESEREKKACDREDGLCSLIFLQIVSVILEQEDSI